ncbi:Detected protein of confused Function [Hibiscus syriacus]|uniref:Detected protein of confused Function n=1 Tax=Hibiscus syriacus TaxID=106335 RepID=A0A6A2X981_HIBSY|nr:Detected protein of confused Function [Hibiscus syriacus]
MTLLSLPPPSSHCFSSSFSSGHRSSAVVTTGRPIRFPAVAAATTTHHHQQSLPIDRSSLAVAEAVEEDQLWAAACLRIRSFNDFQSSSFGIQDHKRYLAEREFLALKERIAGKREGFKRVSCINATLPLSQLSNSANDLCASCKIGCILRVSVCHYWTDTGKEQHIKFTSNGEDRVVVGTLDLNQCLWLPEEIPGRKPEGIEAEYGRAYLSNVCVARELHRNGLGYDIVSKSKTVAGEWGITDLYVHVAVDNEPAKNLYLKSGFIHENDEPAWQARFLDRPRRILLWIGVPCTNEL